MAEFELSEIERAVQDTAREFARKEMMPVAAKYDQSMDYPWEVIEKAHANGFIAPSIPESMGGPELSPFCQALLQEEISYGCSGIATAIMVNDLPVGPLLEAGTKEQHDEFLKPMLESHKNLAAYCVTEPGAGSDVQGIRTRAKRDGDDYILNGSKMWITNASVAGWYYVLATLDPEQGYKAMCAFAVPAKLKGIEVGKKEINLGQRCSDTRGIQFTDVRVPARYLIGEEGMGFKLAMGAFDKSRPNVAAGAVGLAQCCLDHSLDYAKERQAFGKPIARHQAVQFMLADMATTIEAARLLTWKSAKELESGRRNTKLAAMAKCFAGDIAVKAATDAVQIFGGYGYSTEYPVEKLFRDCKIFQIYEGTQQIQRMIVAKSLLS